MRAHLRFLAALACCLWGALAPAQAGQLDAALLGHSGKVLELLHQKGYRTVGVLPFQVKKGTRPASFQAAPLCLRLPVRLENALILTTEAGNGLAVVHDATTAANTGGVGSYLRSQAAFRRLFRAEYELPWGGKKARADAFLTGVVENAGDRARTTVTLAVLDAKSWKKDGPVAAYLTDFSVSTDRALLADLGYGFALQQKALQRQYTAKRTGLAVNLVARRDGSGDADAELASPDCGPDNIAGFRFELSYGGARQKIRPVPGTVTGQRAPEYRVGAAREGAKVRMVVTRVADESAGPLGLVLKVNGQSIWKKETAESDLCRKWVFGPELRGKPQTWEGFYTGEKGKNLLEFRSLGAQESAERARELGGRAGWIDLDVYASKPGKSAGAAGGEDSLPISLPRLPGGGAPSLREYQERLRAANGLKVKEQVKARSGLILHALEPREGGEVRQGKLPNPELIGHLSIRYWADDAGAEEPPLPIAR